ncbi:MAG: LamB/YcsF family protein [Desulfarculus sp.]|nr:MAG: LamB/YcsF family protein [Desulfarculus sp.]
MEIDLHCDMGESFGIYSLGNDQAMMPHVTSISVGCGFHAGDPHVMRQTVALAKEHGVAVGSHPGFPDLIGFGRRKMHISRQEAADYIIYQTGALKAFCDQAGVALQHIKPHGELYQMAWHDDDLARGILEGLAVFRPTPIFLALYNTLPYNLARQMGVRVAGELYADLDYLPDGTTTIKKKHGAVNVAATVDKVLKMVLENKVATLDGQEITVQGRSICLHGDNPRAPELAQALRRELEARGVKILPLHAQSFA